MSVAAIGGIVLFLIMAVVALRVAKFLFGLLVVVVLAAVVYYVQTH